MRFAEAAFHAGRTLEAKEALEQAIPSLQERGDLPATAHAMHVLASLLSRLGDPRWVELRPRPWHCWSRCPRAPRT